MKGRGNPRWDALVSLERVFWERELTVGGVDEVGRGPLAGPVVAAYVRLDPDGPAMALADSKTLSPARRQRLFEEIMRAATAVGVAFVGPREIERVNILQASKQAMRAAVAAAGETPEVLLTDWVRLGGPWREWALLHGDGRSASIAAASIVAKVLRDRYMTELELQYPGYGFDAHKGYATRGHYAALDRMGPSEAHRRTFLHAPENAESVLD